MPELPEVETYRCYFRRLAVGKPIRGVIVSDRRIFPDWSGGQLRHRLVGRTFTRTERRGKYLIAYLDARRDAASGTKAGACMVIHFGMTGSLQFSRSGLRQPPYSRAAFRFDHGALHFVDSRRFGGIWWVADLTELDRIRILGADPLSEINGPDAMSEIVRRSSQPIKQALMNQRLIAGIGNLYADEILFQSRIHPRRRPASLKRVEWERIFHSMKEVLREAIRLCSQMERYPDSYLLPHRGRDGQCPRCGAVLKTLRQGQRTTYYCRTCQK
ncbi:MAG: hypothetical protein HY315_02470 [Acidobacteria bacterium]|nr:hypothetical protein [Acidobacteriota bacterium]